MRIEKLPDGTTKETYRDEYEYNARGRELEKIMGRKGIVYEGWLSGELVRILR